MPWRLIEYKRLYTDMSDRHFLEHSVPPPPSKLHNHILTKAEPESFAFLKKKNNAAIDLQNINSLYRFISHSFTTLPPTGFKKKKTYYLVRQHLHHLIMIYFLIIVALGLRAHPL